MACAQSVEMHRSAEERVDLGLDERAMVLWRSEALRIGKVSEIFGCVVWEQALR